MPYEYRTKRKIEFADTDLAGIVHFARFFVFMETAEHEFLRSLGTSVSTQLDGDKIGWPRLSASCDYLSPLRFEEEVSIHLTVWRNRVPIDKMAFFVFLNHGVGAVDQRG